MKTRKHYNDPENIRKIHEAFITARNDLHDNKPGTDIVSISHENSKMGPVASVSLLPFITCPPEACRTCGRECYAAKIALIRPSVMRAWARNTALAFDRPDLYWPQVKKAISAVRFFRFHVGGDIPLMTYFLQMIDAARENPKTDILFFTKRFNVVNTTLCADPDAMPQNLHTLFSEWGDELKADNPYNLPTTNVIEKGQDPDPSWLQCGGNCFNCACRGVGCWAAQPGQTIAFKKH